MQAGELTSRLSSSATTASEQSSERPRTSLSDRLGSLFSSPKTSRSPSPTASNGLPTRRTTSPERTASSSVASSATLRPPERGPSSSDARVPDVQTSTALRQAIHDTLPSLPAAAHTHRPVRGRMPNSFASAHGLQGSPFLDSLARATVPTYSPSSGPDATADSPILLSQSPPSRTSLDSLRKLNGQERGLHTNVSRSTPSSPSRWWFQSGNKQAVDRLLDDQDTAETVQQEEEQIRRKYRSPKHPIVFCHGLLGFDSIQLGVSFAPVEVSHWRGIKEVLETNGAEVLITRVPATSSIQERAKVLEEKVSEVYAGREVHLIGHSMGGLDCRYMTTHMRSKVKVLSITTIATPHRGSAFADRFLETVGERLPSVISWLDMLPNGGGDGAAFESLTRDSMRKFNEETPDVEGVKYYSWGATYEPGLIDTWKWPHSVILEQEGPNDGLVSVESSRWGEYLGTLENVSHLDLVGWVNTARYKWAEFTGNEIRFKPATFYLGVVDHVARHVENQDDNGEDTASEDARSSDCDRKPSPSRTAKPSPSLPEQ